MLAAGTALAQDAAVQYVYDDLNRLVGVVDPQGNAAAYAYDSVGNLLSIERFADSGQPEPVRIWLISPRKGKVGTRVEILGIGFSATPALDAVAFTGAAATVLEASPNRLVTTVPGGATTGPITVTTPLGTATSTIVFRVLGEITLAPASTSVSINGARQFLAFEAGSPTSDVRWTVNGTGGDATSGTISAEGLYTAPAAVPDPATVTVTATHPDDPALGASAVVTIWPPLFLGSPPVSVRVADVVSASQVVTAGVSVRVAAAETARFVAAAPTSVAVAPVVTTVAPATAAAGSTLTLTLSGAGFAGATSVQVLRNNAADPALTVTGVTVSADGTQATVDVTIAADAAAGSRVVRITTPAGSSTAAGTGGNLFTVQ
jgi:YD repeat-containing protein